VYTQCSKCETIFKLSADVLRAAGGQVRCGRCGELFSALARLAEDASAFTPGESALELETRADSILESTVALKIAEAVAKDYEEYAPPGVEIARLQVLDWSEEDHALDMDDAAADAAEDAEDAADAAAEEAAQNAVDEAAGEEAAAETAATAAAADADGNTPDGDTPDDENRDRAVETERAELGDHSLEFTLPPGELDRIFIETKLVLPDSPLLPPHPESAAAAAAATAEITDSPDATETPDAANARDTADTDIDSAGVSGISGLQVSEEARRDMLAGFEQPLEPQFDLRDLRDEGSEGGAARRRLALAAWLGAGVIAAALLLFQVGQRNPDWPAVRAMHKVLGTPLPQPVNLSAYQLRQWGVSGEPDAGGTLRLRASILNAAAQLQPYPLLRVTLADRFGKRIGTRDFEPSEYLGKPAARQLAPGERVDAILNILDPGKNAEGFEIDVCLRGAERRIVCANDVAPQSNSAPGKP
jgi:predicted Zn finger-like uncharacterized protein